MLVKAGEHVQASEVELSADELKEPLATDSAMSWSKQHTTVRRCGDHNEHSLQHHNAHCTAEEEGTHKSFPHNKTTQKQKDRWYIFGGAPSTDGAPRPGPGSCTTYQWRLTEYGQVPDSRPEKKGASPRRNLVR